jgi:hypothetical protein
METRLMLLFSILFACSTDTYVTTNRCIISIDNASPTEIAVNESLILEAYPMTEEWDTLVYFNNTIATVQSISKDDCQDCEECKELNLCTECDYCDLCIDICDSCVHTIEVTVPDISNEHVDIIIQNAQGTSDPYPFSIRQE